MKEGNGRERERGVRDVIRYCVKDTSLRKEKICEKPQGDSFGDDRRDDTETLH
jgi:hypothetical protein